MNDNKKINTSSDEVRAEINSLYAELEKRFGAGFADHLIRRYTDMVVKKSNVS